MTRADTARRTDEIIARQSALLERALAALDSGAPPSKDATTARAFELLDRTMAALEAAKAELGAGQRDPAALALLERALAFAERRDKEAAAFEALLARALDGIARLEAAVAEKDAELERRTAALDELLALSERSLSAATQREDLARVGFWRRLFGARTPTPPEGHAR